MQGLGPTVTVEVPLYADFCDPNSTLVDSADQEPSRPSTVPHGVPDLMLPVTVTGRVAVLPMPSEPIVQIVTSFLPPVAFRRAMDPCDGPPKDAPVHAFFPPWAETFVRSLQA